MGYNLFQTIITSSTLERDRLAANIIDLIKGARQDENNTFKDYLKDKRNPAKRQAYFESVERLGGILDTLETLGIDVITLMETI